LLLLTISSLALGSNRYPKNPLSVQAFLRLSAPTCQNLVDFAMDQLGSGREAGHPPGSNEP
jgi:hypothetical protein